MNDFDPDEMLLESDEPVVPVQRKTLGVGLYAYTVGAGLIASGLIAIISMLPGEGRAPLAEGKAAASKASIYTSRFDNSHRPDRKPLGGMHFTPDGLERMQKTVDDLEQMAREGKIRPFVPTDKPPALDNPGETREP